MAELLDSGIEKARKAHSRVLQRFAENGKATAIAVQMGASDATISRIKNDKLEDALMVLYLLGFKLVDSHQVEIDADELRGLQAQSARLLNYERKFGRLGATMISFQGFARVFRCFLDVMKLTVIAAWICYEELVADVLSEDE